MPGFFKACCSACKGVNDINFKYCKSCGVERKQRVPLLQPNEDNRSIDKINEQTCALDDLLDVSHYSQQKCQFRSEINAFLFSLQPAKDLYTALPDDIQKFFIFKERKGRTKLHVETCVFKGQARKQSCDCPTTLAVKSVDSLIGKIRAIFRDMGMSGEWNPVLLTGNPASSHIMKCHLQVVKLEQSSIGIARKQAVPLMFDKLGKLSRHLSYQISREKGGIPKFLLFKDRAYFFFFFHSGDRAGD
ncbi:MAG: DUF640 domain-containing protein [Candidatus Thiodiazotropha sp.]